MEIIRLSEPEAYDIILLYLGFVIMVAAIFPRMLKNYLITAPVAYLLLAVGVFIFFSESPLPHLAESPYLGKRLAEIGVIISLTAAGLKIRNPLKWKTWRLAARLLVITMPLTIALTAIFGWVMLGFAPATAMLLGAVIAPTDPVLASDVQTTPPSEDDVSSVRLGLTTEAGLNDGLAFPFTNMAIAMAVLGTDPGQWFSTWLYTDFLYKITVGALTGIVCGWVIAKIFFMCPRPINHNSIINVGLLSLALTLIPYGLAEIVSSYGFISVFVAACFFRHQESVNEYLTAMHDFSEQMERVLVAVLFTFLAVYISHGFVEDFHLTMIPAGLVMLFIIRPLSGMAGLVKVDLPATKKAFISFYGIRGIGSLYYLLYGFYHASFDQADSLLALVVTVMILSVIIHGLTARQAADKLLPA